MTAPDLKDGDSIEKLQKHSGRIFITKRLLQMASLDTFLMKKMLHFYSYHRTAHVVMAVRSWAYHISINGDDLLRFELRHDLMH